MMMRISLYITEASRGCHSADDLPEHGELDLLDDDENLFDKAIDILGLPADDLPEHGELVLSCSH
jgi:hypothetical protein